MTNPTDPHDPYAPRSDRNDPDNPARDPNSEIFSSQPRERNEEPTYDIIKPSRDDGSANSPPPIDPSMVAPPPHVDHDPYAVLTPGETGLGPPPLTPPVNPGNVLRTHNGPVIITLGVASIAIGSVGNFCCAIFGLVGLGLGIGAVLWGSSELRAMKAGTIDPSGRSIVNAGRICGIVGISLAVLSFLSFAAMMIFSVATGP